MQGNKDRFLEIWGDILYIDGVLNKHRKIKGVGSMYPTAGYLGFGC